MPAGKEQFRRAITTFRNLHIVAGIEPLITLHTELIANDEFMSRGGTDDPTKLHMKQLLIDADKMRRHVTHNPDSEELGDKIAKAIDPNAIVEIGENPFGGDDIQNFSGGLIDLPYALDGSDVDIPLLSQLSPQFIKSKGMLILGAIDRAITNWTRCNSRDRTRFITRSDSMRIYGTYQEVLGFIEMYLGDANRVDVVQVLPSQEPLGPQDSPNIKGEAANPQPAA